MSQVDSGRLDAAIDEVIAALFALQRTDGSWEGTLSASAASTADVLIAMQLADPDGCRDLIDRGVSFLLSTQGADGGWGDDVDTPATLNGTALAVASLALIDPHGNDAAIKRGWRRIEEFGGEEAIRDVERCSLTVLVTYYLSLSGLISATGLLRVPIELALLPDPLRRKLTFAMPTAMAWGLMCAQRPAGALRRLINKWATPPALAYLDGLVGFGHGDVGFVESPMMTANVVVGLAQAGIRPDLVRGALDYFRTTIKPEGGWSVTRDLEVDATNFICVGMQHSGLGEDPRVQAGVEWLRGAQRAEEFVWTGAPPGGWGWALPSGWPNTGNTADAVITIAGDIRGDGRATTEGVKWLLRQQNADGSWSCFAQVGKIAAADPSFAMVKKARSPKVLYGSCAVMTAEAISALALSGADAAAAIDASYRWLTSEQAADGSIENKWYLGRVTGTGSVLRALGDAGRGESRVAQRARWWLLLNQNDDGGWGEGVGPSISTVEETAMAVLGLAATGTDPQESALQAGITWLVDNRSASGLWRPSLVGVYFLELLYRHDHTANGYALQALARYRQLIAAAARAPKATASAPEVAG